MKPDQRVSIVLLAALFLALLSGCAAAPQVTAIEGDEREQAIAEAGPIVENLMSGANQKDYASFSRDFDDAMLKALDEPAFNQLTALFDQKIGAYQSLEVEKVERVNDLIVVSYRIQFEREAAVAARVSLREGPPVQVAGIWFDSPKLREK